jgi:hypothetical protein
LLSLKNGFISLTLPNSVKTYTFTENYATVYTNGDYTWNGELVTAAYLEDGVTLNDEFEGKITLIKRGKAVYGDLNIDNDFYQLHDLGGGVSALVKLTEIKEAVGCASFGEGLPIKADTKPIERGSVCPVRVLVLYTQAALDLHPDIEDIANNGIESVKLSLIKSEITTNELEITLVGVQALGTSEWMETPVIAVDLSSVWTDSDITSYRAQYNADLVFVLVRDGSYAVANGATVAFGDDVPIAASGAYALVDAGQVTGLTFTFAHEFGHLFGARHQRKITDGDVGNDCASDGDNTGLSMAHGFNFRKGINAFVTSKKSFKTLVTSLCSAFADETGVNGQRTIQHYSNPDVKFKNRKTGDDTHNNAKVLRDAACRIANNVISNEVTISILGKHTVCPFQELHVEAQLSIIAGDDVLNNYIYKWESSYDWINWFDVVTGPAGNNFAFGHYSVDAPENLGQVIHIRLTVTTPSGAAFTTIHNVSTQDSPDCGHHPLGGGRPANERSVSNLKEGGFWVFPNPNKGEITIHLENIKDSSIELSIFNSFGQIVKAFPNFNGNEDIIEFPMDIKMLPSGTYYVRCQRNGVPSTQKIISINN